MKQLKHENILPFYGVSISTTTTFGLVFPWCENGNIMDYLEKKTDVNQFDLASQSKQIPTCNAYLHPRTAIGCDQGIALPA